MASEYPGKQISRGQIEFVLVHDGVDGNGMEFVYFRTNSADVPAIVAKPDSYTDSNGHTYLDDDFLPAVSVGGQEYECTDNPAGVDDSHQYEWMAVRDKGPADDDGNRQWTKYSGGMTLWSKWGQRGTDGDGVEYVFIRTEDESTVPTIVDNNDYTEGGVVHHYTDDDFRPMTSLGRATDDPLGVSEQYLCEWVAMRTKGAPNAQGVREWLPFAVNSEMRLWAKFGLDNDSIVLAPSLLALADDGSAQDWYTNYYTEIQVKRADKILRPLYVDHIKVFNDEDTLIYEATAEEVEIGTSGVYTVDITHVYSDANYPIMFQYVRAVSTTDPYGQPRTRTGNFLQVTRCTSLAANSGYFRVEVNINHDTSPYETGIIWTNPSPVAGSSSLSYTISHATDTMYGTQATDAVPLTVGSTTKDIFTQGSKQANTVLAAPNGSAGNAVFRALVEADIPTLSTSKISGLGTAATRGVATTIGPSITNLVPGSLLYSVLGDSFDSSNSVKDFINSSIATATADYKNNYNVVSDLGLAYNATHSAIETALGQTISGADNNDYCFVEIPTSASDPTQLARIERYKFNGTSWAYEYVLNNSSFTSAQWASINSGITTAKVSLIDGLNTRVGVLEARINWDNYFGIDNDGNIYVKKIDENTPRGFSSFGFITAGGIGSGGGGGGGDLDVNTMYINLANGEGTDPLYYTREINVSHLHEFWKSLQNNDIVSTYNNYKIALAHIPDDDRLSYVDPEAGEDITIDDPGTTGTVLWGAESANNVALDVNGVSKTLVKQAALDGINSSISNLQSLVATKQDYISDLASIRSNASLGATAYGWGDHSTEGYLKSITSQMVTTALGYTPFNAASFTKANIQSTLGISNWALESTKPSYTFSEIGSKPTTLAGYGITDAKFSSAGVADKIRITLGSNYHDVLTAHQSLSGYATETWVGQQGFITKAVNDLTNYYLKSQTYTQAEVNALIAAINQFHYEVYPSTSSVTDPQSNVLYLIGPTGSGSDKYEEYVYPNSTTGWTKIGDTSIDLTPYLLASVAAQTYVPLTRTVNGHALSSDVTVTKGDVGLGKVDNLAASAYFTVLENSGDQLSATIGGTNKKLTIGYATIATKTRFTPTESGATQIEPLLDWFVPETYTESGVSKVRLRLNPKYTGMYADGFVTAGGAGSGSVTPTSLDAVWNTLRYNTGDYQNVEIDPGHLKTITLTGVVTGSGKTSITTSIADGALTIAKTNGLQSALDAKANTSSLGSFAYKNSLTVSDIPLDDRLSYVDPEAGEEITIDDPGTTGTVLWGAESTNNVALDVNGVSKTLVKQAAMDGVYSSISTLSALISTKQDYISDLSSIRSNASLGATAYSWGDHRTYGYLTSVPTASALTLGIIRVGNGLSIDENGVVSVTGQTQGTVTRVYVGSTAYNPDTNGYVTLPLYAFGTAGTDYVPITIGSATKNVLTAHQTLPTALKNPYKLTWGTNNEYDGSAAVTITAAQLGALTSHQTVTLASGTNNGTLKITTAAGTTDNVAVTGLGTAAYRGVATTIGSNITNLVPGSLLYSVLGDAFDSSNTVVGFVNSSIATATATFRGTNDTATTEADFLTWANALTKTLNDYVFWKTTDSAGNVVFKRYKYGYDGTEAGSLAWRYEYDLNNSSFTSAQWSAINSGITASLVTAFNAKYDKPVGGIPKSDLASAVQTSLGKADTALQAHQTIYGLTIKNSAGTNVLSYTPNSAAGSLTLTKAMVGLGNVENFVYNVPTGAEQTYTYPV